MIKREYLERILKYTYLKNGIYRKKWYDQIIILNANKNNGYIEKENIYSQDDIDEIQLAFNVLNKDLKLLEEFKEKEDIYDLYKLKPTKVLINMKKSLEMLGNEEEIKNKIKVIDRVLKEREIKK